MKKTKNHLTSMRSTRFCTLSDSAYREMATRDMMGIPVKNNILNCCFRLALPVIGSSLYHTPVNTIINTVDIGYKGPLGTGSISPLYPNVPYN